MNDELQRRLEAADPLAVEEGWTRTPAQLERLKEIALMSDRQRGAARPRIIGFGVVGAAALAGILLAGSFGAQKTLAFSPNGVMATEAQMAAALAGLDGDKLTARQIRSRLAQEVVGNASIRVLDTERPDTWEVQGRGELQLAILVEIMRREGFELTVGKPEVVTRTIDGKLCEPMERVAIDAPEDYLGVVSQLLALRRGRLEQMVNHGTGWVRMEYLVPARGLIGFRTEFLTETRGTGQLHHVFEGYEPWHGDLRTRPTGSLIADRRGQATTFALLNLQERGTMFVGPGTEAIAGEGKILTAGALDTHIHFICPQQVDEALYAGITTMLGGGTGPATGTAAITSSVSARAYTRPSEASGLSSAAARRDSIGKSARMKLLEIPPTPSMIL